MGYIFDTNIVTAYLKGNPIVKRKFLDLELNLIPRYISCITYFEIKRGLISMNTTRKLREFQDFCQRVEILFLDELNIIEKASEIYADLKNRGQIIQDADILIAATAIINNLTLVSQDSDLLRVNELNLENWLN